jgi:hypothetical protein
MAKSNCSKGAEAPAANCDRLSPSENERSTAAPHSCEQWLEQLSSDERGCGLWEAWSQLRPSRRLAIVRELTAAADARAQRFLSAALWDERTEIALAAIEGLQHSDDLLTVGSLESLTSITRASRLAAAARAATEAIRTRPVPGSVAPASSEAEYWASFVDGDGAQLLMAVQAGPSGVRRLATAAWSDRRGIVDAWGRESVSEAELETVRSASGRRLESPSDRGAGTESFPEIGWVQVDGAYCAAAIQSALVVNRRDHRRLPGAWEFWKQSFIASAAEGSVEADDRAFPEGQLRRRLPQTASLVHFEGFRSWLILGEDVAPFLSAAREALTREAQDRERLLCEIVSACLNVVVRKPQRRLWRSRLLRQAALWQRRSDRFIPDLCLAAAWGLDDRNGVPSESHPLLRAMTRASLEIALGG